MLVFDDVDIAGNLQMGFASEFRGPHPGGAQCLRRAPPEPEGGTGCVECSGRRVRFFGGLSIVE